MEFLSLLLMPGLALWAVIGMRNSSMHTLTALFVVATACMPEQLFSLRAGGLNWTIDRLVLLAIIGCAIFALRRQEFRLCPLEFTDVMLLAFCVWLGLRTVSQPLGSVDKYQPHTLMHLINGYGIPIFLFFVLRSMRIEPDRLKIPYWILVGLGLYLSITAILEAGKFWSLVYPKFIADSTLGIHFGRARGPMLQSVRLGVCLLASWSVLTVFSIWSLPGSKRRWIFALGTLPLFWGAILVTYTRSIWMGLLLVLAMLVVLCLRGRLRQSLIATGLVGSLVLGIAFGPSLVAFKREYSAAETLESTKMRAAFAYVSVEMFKQRPLAGYGFNQFNIANKEFLSDRSTNIRLESIRHYVHHNSFLSLIVDLGLIGFTLFAVALAALVRQVWALWRTTDAPSWARGIALTALCILAVHLIQMAFHEVSFSSIENTLAFSALGMAAGARRQLSEHGPINS
jgi:O-antigen ligase